MDFGRFILAGLDGEPFRSETNFKSFSNSVFKAEQEYRGLNNLSCHETWKTQFYKSF